MFNSTDVKIEVPAGPYPLCKCGKGTLLPIVIPSEYRVQYQGIMRDAVDTEHPQMRWKCSECGKQI